MKIDGKEVLILHVKKKWWDMEKSGKKTEEYRRITVYWTKRLVRYKPVSVVVVEKEGRVIYRKLSLWLAPRLTAKIDDGIFQGFKLE